MIEKLESRELVNPHEIGKKVNEIIEILNQAEIEEEKDLNTKET